MRVVIDTSAAFKAFAFRRVPLEVVTAIQASEEWEVVISPAMRQELERVLMEKGQLSAKAKHVLERYIALCVLIEPTTKLRVCRDPKDDFILECAVDAQASIIISADEDLLVLNRAAEINCIEVISIEVAYRRFVVGVRSSISAG